jgi:hypothetical protein
MKSFTARFLALCCAVGLMCSTAAEAQLNSPVTTKVVSVFIMADGNYYMVGDKVLCPSSGNHFAYFSDNTEPHAKSRLLSMLYGVQLSGRNIKVTTQVQEGECRVAYFETL